MTVHFIGFQAVFNITILVHTRKIQTILVHTRKRKLGHHVHGTPETSKLNFIWSDRSAKRIEKVYRSGIFVYLFFLFLKGLDHKSVKKGRDGFLTFSDASPLGNKHFYILTVNASSTTLH
jgi:hypothetical protein